MSAEGLSTQPPSQHPLAAAAALPPLGPFTVAGGLAAASGAPGAAPFPIVGIGASAGGLSAFEAFFNAMPDEGLPGMAFVLVQHLAPGHDSALADLLQRHTRMRVFQAGDGMRVLPGCTYVIPPGHDLLLDDGALRLAAHDDRGRPHLTVDRFFSSLARSQRDRAICIVLSGAGTDGSLGLREVKGEGGLVIAQAPATAEHDGMPCSAIATGMVDRVLEPAEMPGQLAAYVRHVFDPARAPVAPPLREGLLRKLCLLLRTQTGHDFSQYKETTLVRRMERRMALHQINQPEQYLRHARENLQEVEALFRDLLIGVTSFFRDPGAFRALDEKVIAPLVTNKPAHETVRVWVCGCSTGEEAYSIAILLHERMRLARRTLKVQVFATDIDRHAIEHARAGVYPASIAAHLTEELLGRCFTRDVQHGSYRIQKHIRDMLVFSEQDVIQDPPFSRLDLVSCRNLLIYLNSELQRKLIPLFHYALLPGGALFLGTSETVGESARLFEVLDRKGKVYTRQQPDKAGARPAIPELVPPLPEGRAPAPHGTPAAMGGEPATLRHLAEKGLLAHLGHAGVLVDSRGQILHIVGRTGRFLEPADGAADMNILAMAREGLRRELVIALHKAVAHKELVSCPALLVESADNPVRARMAVRPLEAGGGSLAYLVILEELPGRPAETAHEAPGAGRAGRLAELEQELRSKEEYLQTTLEEMETANEELRSTNEEMQSINEELQSANEELETSKEELQSVNEELSTVNAELQDKVSDLSRANNDMSNLLAGTGVGTVFVDPQLRITRFTPAATQVINFIATDIGRPLAHVATNLLGYDRMIEDIIAVLETLAPREAEVQVAGGAWYLMRIRPYRTTENLIDGAVITLVDISERRKAEESLRRSEARLHALIEQAHAGVGEVDLDGRFLSVNERLCQTLGYTRGELLRKSLSDVTDPDDLPRVREVYATLVRGGPGAQLDKRLVRKDGVRLPTHERVSAIRDADGRATSLLSLSFELPQACAPR